MKALEKMAEARDKYQVGDLVTIHAAGMGLVGQVVKATKAKATVRVLEGLGTARRPSWADRLADLEWEAVTGALPGESALEALDLPAPPDVEAIAAKLERHAEALKADAKRKVERAKHMPDAARRVASVIRNRKQDTLESAKRAEEQAKACVADSKVYRQAVKAMAKLAEIQAEQNQDQGQDQGEAGGDDDQSQGQDPQGQQGDQDQAGSQDETGEGGEGQEPGEANEDSAGSKAGS